MRQRVVTILVAALIIATIASYIVYRMVQVRIAKGPVQVTHILVAARNLEIGSLVRDADLKGGEWSGPLAKGMVTAKDAVIGRGVISGMYEGEPILDYRLAQVGAGGGLAATIPPGMRACAVKVNEVVGVAGFVLPGMRVDVLISGTPPDGKTNAGPKVKTLLQNIEVLSAGQNIQKDAEGKPVQVQVVNLLVNPEQAEVLSLASNETKIQLVLRNPLDQETKQVPVTAMATLFKDQPGAVEPHAKPAAVKTPPKPKAPPATPVAPATPPVPAALVIEVLNGPKKSEAKFLPAGEDKQ
ncbi:MAG TPA: Flp pilus assembly protein CpaB [Bryobacteraceae bacterium]|nr:Flp pilus assembly protein CpaB [Bryobacteraceae bacterium]